MRFIALDVGEKRIGVARGDSETRIAVPVGTVEVRDGAEWADLARISDFYGAKRFIVGLPRNNQGVETAQSAYVRKFVQQIVRRIPGARVKLQDESLTSVVAEERLKASGRPYQKGDIDAEAAAIILQDFLETVREGSSGTAAARASSPDLDSSLDLGSGLAQGASLTQAPAGNVNMVGNSVNTPDIASAELEKTVKTPDVASSSGLAPDLVAGLESFATEANKVGAATTDGGGGGGAPALGVANFAENGTSVLKTGEEEKMEEAEMTKKRKKSKKSVICRVVSVILVIGILGVAGVIGLLYLREQRRAERAAYYAEQEAQMVAEVFNFTVLPGETIADVRGKLIEAGYEEAEVDEALAAEYDFEMLKGRPEGATLEGYLFGETAEFYETATAEEVIEFFLGEMQKTIDENGLEKKFQEQGLSLFEGITLASVVQKEAQAADMPTVAQVFLSRLEAGMPLGSDVTVSYALDVVDPERDDFADNQAALEVDSCYNTRRYAGLPCGPIANPGIAALKAVAEPTDTTYLYFLTGDDGKMYYSYTEEQHTQNAQEHCQTLCQVSL